MKFFLDDVRDPPDNSWVVCRNVHHLWNCVVDLAFPKDDMMNPYADAVLISLDHDLGEGHPTGYDFLNMLERSMIDKDSEFRQLKLCLMVHSANPVGAENMLRAIGSIYRLQTND
jgi:hypothetical protein